MRHTPDNPPPLFALPKRFDVAAARRILTPIDDVPEQVRSLFRAKATEIRDAGHDHYSADAILHVIRFHEHVERGNREFAVNNNWGPLLARWLMSVDPSFADFFETRASKGDA